ncbi:MAG: resolvase [Cyanobacteriota bacterium]|nr:resolvase [Cyanobacteriota bacterium]
MAADAGAEPAAAASAGAGALAGLDPGRSKCGLVRTDPQQQRIEEACIVSPAAALAALRAWQQQGLLRAVVLGNGTGSRDWRKQLAALGISVQLVDERGSTLAARQRYWELWPPRGWRRLLPPGLRLPPRDLDDLAAQLLLERQLRRSLTRAPETLGA